MSGDCKYDVAFSFLQRDEQLAIDITDRIQNRVKVFIYSEQQKELIANDGVDAWTLANSTPVPKEIWFNGGGFGLER